LIEPLAGSAQKGQFLNNLAWWFRDGGPARDVFGLENDTGPPVGAY